MFFSRYFRFRPCPRRLSAVAQVLWRQNDGDAWNVVGDDNTMLVYHPHGGRRAPFLRASIGHFSFWGVGKQVNLDDPYDDKVVSWGPPDKRELVFINATSRPVTFLVFPTSWAHGYVSRVSGGAEGAEVGLNLEVERVESSAILPEAIDVQVRAW